MKQIALLVGILTLFGTALVFAQDAPGDTLPPPPATPLEKAAAAWANGDPQEARFLVAAALDSNRTDTTLWKLLQQYTSDGDSAARMSYTMAATFRGTPFGSNAAVDYARYLFTQGSPARAQWYLDSMSTSYLSSQTDGRARVLYAECLMVQGQYNTAAACFDTARSECKGPDCCMVRIGQGNALLLGARHSEAIAFYHDLLKSGDCIPLHDLACYQLAEISYNLHDTTTARKYYQDYLQRFPAGIYADTCEAQIARLDSLLGKLPPRTEQAPKGKQPAKQKGPTTYTIQLGAFSKTENAEKLKGEIAKKLPDSGVRIVLREKPDQTLYLVRMGQYPSEAVAESTFRAYYPKRPLPHRIVPFDE